MDWTHVVVGAGSAGCVVAARLSEDPHNRVLLLEAGGRDWNPMFHIPLGTGKLLRDGLYGWRYETEPEAATGGRRIRWPRARVLGGCSSINGMVYSRGSASDYDGWAAAGNRGWSYAEVLPYFLRSETHVDRVGSPWHGHEGPLRVSRARSDNPIYQAFIEAGVQAGFARADDFCEPAPEGFGRNDFNIADGRRCSAARAFLQPALARANLTVLTHAQALRVLFEGRRAVGVAYERGGMQHVARAGAEVVLCGGVVNSPTLLMHSGIGDAAALAALGIPTVHHLPGVGRNLQDHCVAHLRFTCPQPITLHSLIRFDRAVLAMLRAALFRSGPATSFPAEAAAYTRSRPGLPAPDLQWNCVIGLGSSRLRVPGLYPWRPTELEQDGITLGVYLLRPRSTGQVALASADPRDPPRLSAGYLTDRADVAVLQAGVRQVRHVAGQPALAPYVSGELAPGPQVRTDDEIEAWLRASVQSAHHQVGTCAMGRGPAAVVDDQLRVHGVERLRVVDASVMPAQVGGNPQAPVLMIAEKGADLLRGRTLAPAELEPFAMDTLKEAA
jgi:choline dehydrogenase